MLADQPHFAGREDTPRRHKSNLLVCHSVVAFCLERRYSIKNFFFTSASMLMRARSNFDAKLNSLDLSIDLFMEEPTTEEQLPTICALVTEEQ